MTTIEAFKAFAQKNMMEVEAILHEVYAARCRDRAGYVLFDGGAHKAWHTLRMLALPGCELVYAVEADPFMAKTWQSIIETRATGDLDRVTFVGKALQRDPAVSAIRWKSSTSHVGRSSIVADNRDRPTIWGDTVGMAYRDEMQVPATTIDLILAQESRPMPFLKLDLEGADLVSLFGAAATLCTKRPVVAFENSVHAPKVHGFTLEEVAAFFDSVGYVPMNFVGEPIGPANWFGFFEAWAAPRDAADWLKSQLLAALARRKT
jgi:FkbM family methyltransferase